MGSSNKKRSNNNNMGYENWTEAKRLTTRIKTADQTNENTMECLWVRYKCQVCPLTSPEA